jgi:hypothetical protein
MYFIDTFKVLRLQNHILSYFYRRGRGGGPPTFFNHIKGVSGLNCLGTIGSYHAACSMESRVQIPAWGTGVCQ